MEYFYLPEEIVGCIIKLLKPNDRLTLLKADVWPSIHSLLKRTRRVSFEKDYTLSSVTFQEYFQLCTDPELVRYVNISHCYWLPHEILMQAICGLPNLEEIHLQDTQLTFNHTSQILQKCPKITRLSMSIQKTHWDAIKEVMAAGMSTTLKEALGRLSHLRISWIASPPYWHPLLRFLKKFHNVKHLQLEQCYEYTADCSELEQLCVNLMNVQDLPFLSNLRSLVCTRKKYENYYEGNYEIFCCEMVQKLDLPEMEHIWIQCKNQELPTTSIPRRIKTWWLETATLVDFSHCQNLTHLGGLKLDSTIFLPNLRHVSGIFSSYQDLFEFLKLHPKLEFLSVMDSIETKQEKLPSNFFARVASNCQLLKMHKLVYWINSSLRGPLKMLLKMCPNLAELGLYSRSQHLENSFEDLISCARLRRLKIELQLKSINNFRQVFKKCRLLESLHLSVCHLPSDSKFFKSLPNVLPVADNLREFRLGWSFTSGVVVIKILGALCSCSRLQRIVLNELNEGCDHDSMKNDYPWLPALAVQVATSLTELICFCLILDVNDDTLHETRRLFAEKMGSRPSLWFSAYSQFPNSHDIPQIHYEQMIYVANETDSYPKFW